MSPAAFSRGVTSHSDLLASIRAGKREPRRLLRLRMEDYATLLIDQARERALSVLLDGLGERGVAEAVDRLIDLLDRRAGDTDLEEVDEREPDDDDKGDVSWTEHHTRGRHKLVDGGSFQHEPVMRADGHGVACEDDEDDDPREANGDEHDTGDAEDDELSSNARYWAEYWNREAGCEISDPGGGAADDVGEEEQMLHDVPTLQVVSLDHNLFTDKRQQLGRSNLLSSFRTNGEAVTSADSGEEHRLSSCASFALGAPV